MIFFATMCVHCIPNPISDNSNNMELWADQASKGGGIGYFLMLKMFTEFSLQGLVDMGTKKFASYIASI